MVFGVAVPVFNQAEFLPTTLASLVAQSPAFQVAVMDATPDDSVQRVLAGYTNVLSYSRHGPDGGQAAAIQEGWDQLKGDILHWLNADDYLLPSAFKAVAGVFESNPEVDVVYGDALFVDRNGTFTSYFPLISDRPSSLIQTCCIAQPACFVRRRAVERVGGLNVNLHYIMDWDLWTRLYLAGAKFFYLRSPLAAVRMYPETKTSSGSDARLREIRRHLREYAGFGAALRASAAFIADNGQINLPIGYEMLRQAVHGYRKFRLTMVRAGVRPPLKELYGMEIHTNRVTKRAELWLPWYGEYAPRELTISGHWSGKIKADVDGVSTRRKREGRCIDHEELVFALPENLHNGRLLKVTLHNERGTPWCLTAAKLD